MRSSSGESPVFPTGAEKRPRLEFNCLSDGTPRARRRRVRHPLIFDSPIQTVKRFLDEVGEFISHTGNPSRMDAVASASQRATFREIDLNVRDDLMVYKSIEAGESEIGVGPTPRLVGK
jgi:hypothetical protein